MSLPVPAPAPRDEFLGTLSLAGRKVRTLFDALLRHQGLTLSRARLLLHLSRHQGVTQTELAGVLELEPPTVVRLLDALERQGLVERRPVPGDRRSKHVLLTEASRPSLEAVERLTVIMRHHLLSDISDEDLGVTARVLERLAQTIDRLSPEALLADPLLSPARPGEGRRP
ncbi:MarR family winged helix-turn-helix transcriptional regulator [Pararhodospirillum oryzae]|uniref:MarR family transcriptional regulator n=1 Tax=Pararhodospirillum oryzae TaxID=478448 RepID=A0A512HAS5_9PROT|nr:MarR family transcriptional regulator [Pararhodospirillum oryzae]GEO82542.1 MarR family transcriptional regulator [Pararhodospirillum oryzae]